ncbi:MAG: M28 family peptidase [Planctomycetota bacterium]
MNFTKSSFLFVPLFAGVFAPLAACQSSLQKGLDTIRAEEAMVHVKYLASKELAGRDTGDPGCEKAAEYLVQQFEKLGLEPFGDVKDGKRTFLQHYPLAVGQMDPSSGVTIISADGKMQQLALGTGFRGMVRTPPPDITTETPIVDAGVFVLKADEPVATQPGARGRQGRRTAKIKLPESVKDSFVIIQISDFGGLNVGDVHSSVATALREAGAAGAFITNMDAADYDEKFNRSMNWAASKSMTPGKPDPRSSQIPRSNNPPIFILPSATSAKSLAGSKVKFKIQGETREYYATNVVGILRGSDATLREEYIIHSAHYDHVGMQGGTIHPGADDNASGTSCILETAQAYKSVDAPKRSIVFLLVSGEEKGLWGSDFFVKNPPVPLQSMIANINTDMVGRSLINGAQKPEYMMMTPSTKNKDFNTLAARSLEISEMYGFPNMANGDIYWQRSDHYNFAKHKIPTMFLCNGEHEDYHRPGDTWDKIDGGKIERSAKLSFHLGYETAMAAEKPKLLGAQKPEPAKTEKNPDEKESK